MNIERFRSHLPAPLSSAVRSGDFIFMSGVVALDSAGKVIDGDIRVQTRAVLETIRRSLCELGLEVSRVVRATVWLADLAELPAFNEEYATFFCDSLPARSCVQATLYGGARVEIEVQALAEC